MNNKWLTKFIIFVFLLSTFSNSALVATPAFAETGNEDEVTEKIVYEDGEYDVPVEFLHESEDKPSAMDEFVKDHTAKIEIKKEAITATITLKSGSMIKGMEVEVDGKLQEVELLKEDEEEDTKVVQFPVEDLNEEMNGVVAVEVPGIYDTTYKFRAAFDATEIPVVEEEKDESTEDDKDNDGSNEEESTEDNKDENNNEIENPDAGNNEEEKEENNAGNDSGNGDPEEKPFLEDGVYEFAYKTEGSDLTRYYEDNAIVIVKDGQEYLQFQGKSMRQFIEYLYFDGKEMDVSAPINDQKGYIAQIPLEESLKENNKFTFTMVINAAGRIMDHSSTVKLDLMSKKQLANDAFDLIEGVPAKENEDFQDHKNVYSYEFASDLDLSRYYENTIDVLDKNGKTYLEFKGTGMSTFIEALYVDGKKMAIKENGDGSYIAQIEHEKALDEAFTFDMIIN